MEHTHLTIVRPISEDGGLASTWVEKEGLEVEDMSSNWQSELYSLPFLHSTVQQQ